MAKYRVDSYFINVGAGDAAIHALIDTTEKGGRGKKQGTVKRLVLIDGGERADHMIRTTLEHIKNKYHVEDPDSEPRFDAIVITHWDSDHYEGVEKLLSADAQDNNGSDDSYKCKYTKYGTTSKDLRTTLYSPELPETPKKILFDETDVNGERALTVKYGADGDESRGLCRWVKGEDAIGVDLFTNTPLGSGSDWKKMTSLEKAHAQHPNLKNKDASAPPVFLVMGVADKVPNGKKKSNTPDPRHVVSRTGQPDDSVLTNQASVMAVLLWPGKGEDGLRKVSLYTGGDSEDPQEDELIDWLKRGWPKNKGPKISTVKVGHHGAMHSTTSRWQEVKVDRWIFSSGTKHNHPSWPAVAFLLLLNQAKAKDLVFSVKEHDRVLFNTCRPHWMITKWNNNAGPDIKWFNEEVGQKYVESMEKVAKLAAPDGKGPIWDPVAWFEGVRKAANAEKSRLPSGGGGKRKREDEDEGAEGEKEKEKEGDKDKESGNGPDDLVDGEGGWNPTQRSLILALRPHWNELGWPPALGCSTVSNPSLKWADKDCKFILVQSTKTDTLDALSGWVSKQRGEVLGASRKVGAARTAADPDFKERAGGRGLKRSEPMTNTTKKQQETKKRRGAVLKAREAIARQAGQGRGEDGNDGSKDDTTLLVVHHGEALAETTPAADADADADAGAEGSSLTWLADAFNEMYVKACLGDLDMSTLKPGEWTHPKEPTSNAVLSWFSEALFATSLAFQVRVVAEQPAPIVIDTTRMRLEGRRTGADAGPPWSLTFSTSQDAFKSQFGTGSLVFRTAQTPESAAKEPKAFPPTWGTAFQNGMTDLILGQVFSLDPSVDNRAPRSIKELVQFLEAFEGCPSWLFETLNDVPLRLDADGSRSFITYCPDDEKWTAARLQLTVLLDESKWLADLVKHAFWSGLELRGAKVIGAKAVTRSGVGHEAQQVNIDSTLFLTGSLSGSVPGKTTDHDLDLVLGVHAGGYMVMLQFNQDRSALPDDQSPLLRDLLKDWFSDKLKDVAPLPENLVSVLDEAVQAVGKVVHPRQIVVLLGQGSSFESLRIDLEVDMSFGAPPDKSVPFFLTLQWWENGPVEISGSLWDQFLPGVLQPKGVTPPMLDVFREEFLELVPSASNPQDYLSLPHIIPGQTLPRPPPGVPDEITAARVDVIYDKTAVAGKGVTKVSVTGRLECEPQPEGVAIPTLQLEDLTLSFSYEFGGAGRYSLLLRGTVTLLPRGGSKLDAISLTADVSHNDTDGWAVEASLVNVKFGHLYEIFEGHGQRDAVQNFLEHVSIPHLDMKYQFSGGQPSRLEVAGALLLGPVQLSLRYEHVGASNWNINASLKPGEAAKARVGSGTLTIDGLLGDINEGAKDLLPSFIADLELPLDELGIELTCKRSAEPGHETMVVFCLEARLSDFRFSFVQIQDHKALDGAGKATAPPKRMLRVAMTGLPQLKNMPIIDALEQPFDQLDFLWLSQDLTRGELQVLNRAFYDNKGETLYFTDTVNPSKRQDSDKLGAAGCHFQVVVKENGQPQLVLDHVFARQSPAKKDAAPRRPRADGAEGGNDDDDNNDDNGADNDNDRGTAPPPSASESTSGNGATTTAPLSKTFGTLAVRDISLSMVDSKLRISLSASATLGPLSLDVMGLTLAVNLSQLRRMSDLKDLTSQRVSLSFSGLALQYAEAPVTLAGLLKHVSAGEADGSGGEADGYAGGVILAVDPYTFCAVGAYEKVRVGSDSFKTVFVFAKLEGPLVELEFAELSGVTGGFGYNSALRLPTTAAELPAFPFLSIGTGPVSTAGTSSSTTTTTTPMDQLRSLIGVDAAGQSVAGGPSTPWVSPKDGSMWLTFGLSATALQCLTVQALVSIYLSSTPVFGLLATAVATMPPDSPPQDAVLLAELYVAAVVNPAAGVLTAVGALSPRSFILSSSCHLTGGFALSSWFSGSPHEGDWVFTAGGWHPLYVPPAHYPAAPARVGISWAYDSDLSVRGEAYFAITPHVCMAGGRLDAVLDKGDLNARFSAWADFLIKYKPFYFLASVGVEIAVSFVLHLLFWTKTIRVSLGADLELWGPPIGGIVHVSLWFIHFSVHFGPGLSARDPLTFEEFDAEVRKALEKEQPEARRKDFVLAATAGVVPRRRGRAETDVGVEAAQDEPWMVRANTFVFEVHARYPILEATTNGGNADAELVYTDPLPFKLMQKPDETWTTTVDVTVKRVDAVGEEKFKVNPIFKQVPAALWTTYDPADDPLTGSKTALREDATHTVRQTMGLTMTPPHPGPPQEDLPTIDAKDFDLLDVFGVDEGDGAKPDPILPSTGEAAKEFTAFTNYDGPVERKDKIAMIRDTVSGKNTGANRDMALKVYHGLYGGDELQNLEMPTRFLDRLDREWRVVPEFCQLPDFVSTRRPAMKA